MSVRDGDRTIKADGRELAARIAALAPELRDAVLLVDVLGLSVRRAAGQLGVPLARLCECLARGRAGVTEPGGAAP